MFFSCTGRATVSFIHDAGPEPHYLRGAGGSQCRHYSSHESQVNLKKKKKKDSLDSSLGGSSAHDNGDKATRREGGDWM